MRILFIPYLSVEKYAYSSGKTKKEFNCQVTKNEFVFPKNYLDDRSKLIINGLLFGFEILKLTYEDGVLFVQAELNNSGKIMILEGEKHIERQLYEYFYLNFKQESPNSGTYQYKGIKYKLSLIFLDISF